MSERLNVDSGETYQVYSETTEEWAGADVNGTLDVQGTLKLVDNPDTPSTTIDATDGIDLPMTFRLKTMQAGTALILIGILGVLGGLSAILRNYAAIVVLMLAVIALVMAGLFGLGLEMFWTLIVATTLTIGAGMAVRWL